MENLLLYYVAFTIKTLYLFFILLLQKALEKGYGTQILNDLKRTFSLHRFALCIEPPDDSSLNNEQRLKRKEFYRKNGFSQCDYKLGERGIVYEMMSYNGDVRRNELE